MRSQRWSDGQETLHRPRAEGTLPLRPFEHEVIRSHIDVRSPDGRCVESQNTGGIQGHRGTERERDMVIADFERILSTGHAEHAVGPRCGERTDLTGETHRAASAVTAHHGRAAIGIIEIHVDASEVIRRVHDEHPFGCSGLGCSGLDKLRTKGGNGGGRKGVFTVIDDREEVSCA